MTASAIRVIPTARSVQASSSATVLSVSQMTLLRFPSTLLTETFASGARMPTCTGAWLTISVMIVTLAVRPVGRLDHRSATSVLLVTLRRPRLVVFKIAQPDWKVIIWILMELMMELFYQALRLDMMGSRVAKRATRPVRLAVTDISTVV